MRVTSADRLSIPIFLSHSFHTLTYTHTHSPNTLTLFIPSPSPHTLSPFDTLTYTHTLFFFLLSLSLSFLSSSSSLPPQALADQRVHPVCCALLCLRHLRHVPVLLAQAKGERSRGRQRPQAHGRGFHQLSPPRVPHGPTPRRHGHRLLSCLCGNCRHGFLFFLFF